jgi:surface polysaccharide O-acyltransferase-like enzyme
MKPRKVSIDLMRIIASLAVIIIHVTAVNWYKLPLDQNWLINNFINSLVHSWAVPLFLVISGSLLLAKDCPIKTIYKKYIPRVLICLIIWHFIYYFYVTKIFSFSSFVMGFTQLIQGKSFSHLWYLYVLIGIYILLPLLAKLVKVISKKEYLYLLIIMGIITIIVPTIKLFFNVDINPYFSVFSVFKFSEYIFYFLLGYYLYKYPIKNIVIIRILLIITVLLNIGMAFYSNYMGMKNGIPVVYAQTYTVLGTFSVIGIYSFVNRDRKMISKFINMLGELSFGVYLIHFLIIKIIFDYIIHFIIISPIIDVLLITMSVWLISYVVSFILSKIPIIKKIIGL